ncbi:MAG: N-6 DNA methylase [Xenococcaceae cyanobacterium MO_167.B27]|nr:N-6 DNA methylase [Xenococcaceae cyanobacterium MO_167.B27]
MRNIDGLQPQESFDELLKYLFYKQHNELSASVNEQPSITSVRKDFVYFLEKTGSWLKNIWRDNKIYLSDRCLTQIHQILYPIVFSSLNYDIRSQGLKEFLTGEIRKGLGIYLTPDEVAKAIVEFVNPQPGQKCLDPACGSGTFLIEYAKFIQSKSSGILEIFGIDKNPRMLLLSELNLNHITNIKFYQKLEDSIQNTNINNEYDLIITNPPFGVTLDSRHYDFKNYITCKDPEGYILKKQSSEIVFVERCLQFLLPGGTLAVIVPKSFATNNNLQFSRNVLKKYGYVFAIMNLPPETFATTGTQTNTLVLFIKKYKYAAEAKESLNLCIANISNVGFDATGRFREGSQLSNISHQMKRVINGKTKSELIKLVKVNKKSHSFANITNILINQNQAIGSLRLQDVCQVISTGKTPARKDYTEKGYFLIKVGNLTNSGINWEARDRNFINYSAMEKRKQSKKNLLLQKYDILLTSSAHNPVYIAKKSDIFDEIPEFIEHQEVSFVGEVMLVRPDTNKINPFILLAFLRSPETIARIQSMIRGQTAHLHSKDLGELIIPPDVFEDNSKYAQVAALIEKQTLLNQELNHINAEQYRLLSK